MDSAFRMAVVRVHESWIGGALLNDKDDKGRLGIEPQYVVDCPIL